MKLFVSLNGRQRRVAVFTRMNNGEGVGEAVFTSLSKRGVHLGGLESVIFWAENHYDLRIPVQ